MELESVTSSVSPSGTVETIGDDSNEGGGVGRICDGDTVVVWCVNAGGVRLLSDGGESGLASSRAPS